MQATSADTPLLLNHWADFHDVFTKGFLVTSRGTVLNFFRLVHFKWSKLG